MSEFKKKLRAVFDKASPFDRPSTDDGTRYVPRGLNGGPGWQVFDRRENRFLSNKEVKAIPIDNLIHEPMAMN